MILIHIRILTLLLVEAIYEWNYSLNTVAEESMKDIRYEQGGIEIYR